MPIGGIFEPRTDFTYNRTEFTIPPWDVCGYLHRPKFRWTDALKIPS